MFGAENAAIKRVKVCLQIDVKPVNPGRRHIDLNEILTVVSRMCIQNGNVPLPAIISDFSVDSVNFNDLQKKQNK
jgi:hypothetical protein